MKTLFRTQTTEPHFVIFEVLSFKGRLKKGSTMEAGERFVGEYHPKQNKVFFTDVNEQEWTFTPGETCEIIDTF